MYRAALLAGQTASSTTASAGPWPAGPTNVFVAAMAANTTSCGPPSSRFVAKVAISGHPLRFLRRRWPFVMRLSVVAFAALAAALGAFFIEQRDEQVPDETS